jgi:hypothetical protein
MAHAQEAVTDLNPVAAFAFLEWAGNLQPRA